ncbi:MAG: RHS repeat-associated core domain-containing protein [Leptospiraceae bacterium]|nr:RHS repeat-associated core domain-containing protein [Leptospiraceae bacterium]
MLTNTSGEVVAGTTLGSGKSIISYTPYGEIDRDHSGGPDIFRYKYTGQEEDKETGLYYYKARYYDPKIGRFLQPDTVLQTSSPFGTNQYMYVEGNPVMYNDPTGHCINPVLAKDFSLNSSPNWLIGESYFITSHNYTGPGRCENRQPDRKSAYQFLFLESIENIDDPNKQHVARLMLHEFVMSNIRKGKETFLDGLNTDRKKYTMYLGTFVLADVIKSPIALLVYNLMTRGGKIKEPVSVIDRASYNHDYSHGSNPFNQPKAKEANNQWVKSAWKNSKYPWEYGQAFVGTILFKGANLIGDLGREIGNIKKINVKEKICGKKGRGCKGQL